MEIHQDKSKRSVFMRKESYVEVFNKVREAKDKQIGSTLRDNQRLKCCDLVKAGSCKKLIYPLIEDSSSVKFYRFH
jgi:hypothetical protein